jgi:ANTAR domain/PAS fold
MGAGAAGCGRKRPGTASDAAPDSEPQGWVAAMDALAGGSSQPVARYRYDVRSATWWWSRDMYLLHGFEPGEVVPTTELMMAHKDVGDRSDALERAQAVIAGGEPFCWRHRIIDAGGRTRTVLSLGEGARDAVGEIVAVEGFFVDVTDALRREIDTEAHEAVARAALSRAVIEQAKGILMVLYGSDADAAFELLRWHSQHRNLKLRSLSEGLVHLFCEDIPDAATLRRRVSAYLDPCEDGEEQPRPPV